MSLQDRLMELSPYNVDFKFCGEWFLIGIEYKKGWQVIKPSNELIEHLAKGGRYYYCAPSKEVSVDEVFGCISETIEHNKDLEKKVELFQAKVGELQEIFSSEDLATLQTLEFKFKKNGKKGRKPSKAAEPAGEGEKAEKEEETQVYEDFVEEKGKPVAAEEEGGIYVDDGVKYVDTLKDL